VTITVDSAAPLFFFLSNPFGLPVVFASTMMRVFFLRMPPLNFLSLLDKIHSFNLQRAPRLVSDPSWISPHQSTILKLFWLRCPGVVICFSDDHHFFGVMDLVTLLPLPLVCFSFSSKRTTLFYRPAMERFLR